MQKLNIIAGVAATLFAMPLAAQDRAARLSAAAIFDGNLASAEQVLDAERRVFPNKPEVLLNLAAVYAQTGRQAEAARLYHHVLGEQDVSLMLTADREAGAHELAQAGLIRLAGTQTAAR